MENSPKREMVSAADIADSNDADDNVDSDNSDLHEAIIAALCTVYDPEIPVNIYDLGLIYNVVIGEYGKVHVTMTLTAPGCPVAETFPDTVADAVRPVDGVNEVSVDITFDPPWTKDMMSEAAQLQLGMY